MRNLASSLNDAGYSIGDGVVIKLPVRFTEHYIKEEIVKPYIKKAYGKTSTTQLSITELQQAYEDIDQIIAERSGVSEAWPSEEEQMLRQIED